MGIFSGDFSAARGLFQQGELEQALAEVDRVVGLFGQSLEALELQTEIREVIVAKNRSPEAEAQIWFHRGAEQFAIGNMKGAIAFYEQALRLKPDFYSAWGLRGIALTQLGEQQEATGSYDQMLQIEVDSYAGWTSRGMLLYELGRYREAIKSYDQALKLKPDGHQAWRSLGMALTGLGQYKESLESFKQVLQLEPEDFKTLYNQGNSMAHLGDYSAAISSYEQALKLQPNLDLAWSGLGNSWAYLHQHKKAILSYEQVLKIKPGCHKTLYDRGVSLDHLGQYEQAIENYDQALQIKPDYHEAWNNRGVSLDHLGQYEAAIENYDRALQIKPDYYEVWYNRSIAAFFSCGQGHSNPYTLQHPELNQPGYPGQLASLTTGLLYCPAETTPLGHGFLQRWLGNAYWDYAHTQANPDYYRKKALAAYNHSLDVLTPTDHPEERLQTLQKLIRTHDVLRNLEPAAMTALLRQGTDLRTCILAKASSDEQRDRLSRTLPNFNQLTVDFHLREGKHITALETAEADKNGLMSWLVSGTASYAEMREMLAPDTAIVYWHLGANAIVTFILRSDQAEPIVLTEIDREIALKTRNELDKWIEKWNKNYNSKDKETNTTWRTILEDELKINLAKILNIPALRPNLRNLQNLILVPHRDLHRLPLHTFFPDHTVTHLPSLHLGRRLRPTPALTHNAHLLNISAPDHTNLSPLPDAAIESHILDRVMQHRQITTRNLTQATHQDLTQAITQPHSILHFNGHAGYNDSNPKLSSLGLQGDDCFTMIDLCQLPHLSDYNLITLTSCETAITGNQTIISEYVGIASAFLGHGIPHVLSTLWTIESAPSTLFILQFYRQILKGRSPAQALTHSQTWMRTVTKHQLHRHYTYWIEHLPSNDRIRAFLKTARTELGIMEECPYSDRYYWAAFILLGRTT